MNGKRHKDNCKKLGIDIACNSLPPHTQIARDAHARAKAATKGTQCVGEWDRLHNFG
jgi:hypothetical protein